jgi:hypothetical protein
VAPKIGIRLIAAALMTVSAASVATPSTSFAANPPNELLIADDPLPGYTVAEGGDLNGPIDAGVLMELSGTDTALVPDEVRAWSGEARTWVNDAGGKVVIFVIDCDHVDTASDYLTGAVRGTTKASESTFDPGFAGSWGFTEKTKTMPLNIVIWRQSTFYVEVMVRSDGGIADAKALALSEAAFLRSSTGAVPAAGVASSSSAEDSSIAYQAGRLTGTACLVGLVVFLIRNGKKRRDEREAHRVRMATPPPVFPVRTLTPAATDNSAWARVPPPPPPPPI